MESNIKQAHGTGARNAQTINVGSRKSQLALIQTNLVIEKLKQFYSNNPDKWEELHNCHNLNPQPEPSFNVISMTTTGDRVLDKPLQKIGAKSLFTRDLENELIARRVDFVVHSLKDLPTTLPENLIIGAVTERDDPEDTIILKESLRTKLRPLDLLLGHDKECDDLKLKIGTSSQRRIAMVKRCNPKLECIDIRGNLNTRLSKLDQKDGEYAAIILARAGIDRMGWSQRASCQLKPDNANGLFDWCYAVGQGALAVECRTDDDYTLDLLSPIVDLKTTYEVIAERSLMKRLEAGCSVPLGVRSTLTHIGHGGSLNLRGIVLSLDGQKVVRAQEALSLIEAKEAVHHEETGNLESLTTGIKISKLKLSSSAVVENMINCSELGVKVANKMIDQGCRELLSE